MARLRDFYERSSIDMHKTDKQKKMKTLVEERNADISKTLPNTTIDVSFNEYKKNVNDTDNKN